VRFAAGNASNRTGLHQRPIPFKRGTHPAKTFGDFVSPLDSSNIIDNETANAIQAENIGTFSQVPPDLKRFYFGHVHCPAVSNNFG
jgi:hypothetical protein